MNDIPPGALMSPLIPAPLFATAAALLVASLVAPVIDVLDEPLVGWQTAYMTAWSCVGAAWSLVTREESEMFLVVPMFLGTAANLTLLTSATCGRKLRHRHAQPMLILAINGFLAGLVMPAIMGFDANRFTWEAYSDLYFGYWMWIGSLALVAAGWGCVVWKQRLARREFAASGPPE